MDTFIWCGLSANTLQYAGLCRGAELVANPYHMQGGALAAAPAPSGTFAHLDSWWPNIAAHDMFKPCSSPLSNDSKLYEYIK